MAVNTVAQGSVVLTSKRLVQMATPTEIVKLLLHDRGELRIAVMTVDAKPLPGVVFIVVVTINTTLFGVIDVGKLHRRGRRDTRLVLRYPVGLGGQQHQQAIGAACQ